MYSNVRMLRSSRRTGAPKSQLKVIDCDIHPSLNTRADLYPFLSKRWQEHLETYGDHLRTPFTSTTPYPRSSPLSARRDAWPPNGGLPPLKLGSRSDSPSYQGSSRPRGAGSSLSTVTTVSALRDAHALQCLIVDGDAM